MGKKEDLGSLISQVVSENHEVPVQKVTPIKVKKKESPFTLHFPDDVLKNLKRLALEKETSIKNLIVSAVEEKYFTK